MTSAAKQDAPNGLRLVMHIGPPKTATSYLQQQFVALRGDLAKRGWLFPETGSAGNGAHHHLAYFAAKFLDADGVHHRKLKALVADADRRGLNVLMSAEGFSTWKPENYERLRTIFGGRSLDIVYTVRDPVTLFHSHWSEQVKHGHTLSLLERHAQYFEDPTKSRVINPLVVLDKLRDLDATRLHVLLYEEISRGKLDIFDLVMKQVLGIGDLPPRKLGRANERNEIEMTEFIRVLVKMTNERDRVHGRTLRQSFMTLSSEAERDEIVRTVRAKAESAKRELVLSRDEPALLGIERRLRKRYAAAMIPPAGKDPIFQRGIAHLAHYDEDALRAVPEVKALLDEMASRLKRAEKNVFYRLSARLGRMMKRT
jgi:hypothetical protein